MRRDWFSPRRLSIRLAKSTVANQEVVYLILANLLLTAVFYYGGFTWANDAWTWLTLYEFILFVIVTIVGMSKCYVVSGGDANAKFASDFSCLSFPVWFWTLAIVWGTYWAVKLGFRQGIIATLSYDKMGFYETLAVIGGNIEWLWTFIAIIGAQVMFFIWLHASLRRVARIRNA